MKIYLVGGAVRDKMLGLPVQEKDYVVVGATVADMLAQGFRKVGKEFPVFLHPKTHEEYALARMERKTAPGYKGFAFDTSNTVTLEEDLIRRDLTINAMAESDSGELFDPYHGKQDLEARMLRHVSPAFAEDPVRILRIARFLARYHYLGFKIADETMLLMQTMVANGEVNALVAERVWKELERALGEKNPEQFFATLEQAHAMKILFPAIQLKTPGMKALMAAAAQKKANIVRFAVLLHDIHDEKVITALCHQYRIPNDFSALALVVNKHYQAALNAKQLNAEQLLTLFLALDIFRRAERFQDFLQTLTCIDNHFDDTWLKNCADNLKTRSAICVKELIQQNYTGIELAHALKKQRLLILNEILQKN